MKMIVKRILVVEFEIDAQRDVTLEREALRLTKENNFDNTIFDRCTILWDITELGASQEDIKCPRCDGDGKAHGSDRPFEWHGPGTYPGLCPLCNGTGKKDK